MRPVWRDLPGTEQLAFERFGLSLLDTWIHVKLPWLPCKQNRDRVVCKIKDVPKRSFGKGTKSQTSLEGKGITIGKKENVEFPLWEIKLENGKILTEARYRFDILTEPEVSNDPRNSDSPPTVPEELMHLFQSDSSVSAVPPLLLLSLEIRPRKYFVGHLIFQEMQTNLKIFLFR